MQNKKQIIREKFVGERALFGAKDLSLNACVFASGESALKHSEQITAKECVFEWKYPLWYSQDIEVLGGCLAQMARAGMWYVCKVKFKNVLVQAPKSFRKSREIRLRDVNFTQADETLWGCQDVVIKNVSARGDYFGANCENLVIEGLNLDGNYCFDGCKNVQISNSKLLSKDAFWNCENVTAKNCLISGEYLAWNSKHITLIDCIIQSLQGLCYIENLVMKGCQTIDTTLAFEYSSVDIELVGGIKSVKNPLQGVIKADRIDELVMDKTKIDPSKTKVICEDVGVNLSE